MRGHISSERWFLTEELIMGTAQFDRQAFIEPKDDHPPRNPFVVLIFRLSAVVVLAVAAFIAYKFGFKTLGAGSLAAKNPELTSIEQKLASMEYRIGQLEKKRKNPGAEPVAPERKQQGHAEKSLTSLTGNTPRVVYLGPQRAGSQQNSSASIVPMERAHDIGQMPDIGSLQRDFRTSREEWEAITNRIGSVVGELGSQRSDIESQRQSLDVLLERAHRQVVPFQLQKKAGWLHIGSVAVRLRSTDPGSGRYTLRLQINDNSVELKDRVVQEVVEFYTPSSVVPIELVVNSIHRNEVSGKIAVPQGQQEIEPRL
jgi:hypothetical protein